MFPFGEESIWQIWLILFYNSILLHFISDHSDSNRHSSQDSLVCISMILSVQKERKSVLALFHLEAHYQQMFSSSEAKRISIFVGGIHRTEISSSHWNIRPSHNSELGEDKM